MTWLYALPATVQALVVVLACCGLALLPYFLARYLLLPRTDEQTKDLAGSVIFRVSALHGLILALVFAQELLNFSDLRHTMTREAALVGNIFYDLQRYDEDETVAARQNLAAYVDVVLTREWQQLGASGELVEAAWDHWKAAYLSILDLVPAGVRQQELKRIMVEQVREVSELRIRRETAAVSGVNRLFLFAALGGIVLIGIAYFPFPPAVVNVSLITIFAVYTGFVVYFIIAFANPFSGSGYIEPVRFERLYEGMQNSLGRSRSAPAGDAARSTGRQRRGGSSVPLRHAQK